jgi:putative ABC transport system permease protein
VVSVRELALASVRHRKAGFAGVFVAVLAASILVTALGVLVESGLRGGVAPQRYAGADVVVAANQAIPVPEDVDLPLAERVRLPAGVVDEVRAVPGVESAVGDLTVPASLEDVPVLAHDWAAATVTPYTLVDGTEPRAADEVVLDIDLARRTGAGPGDDATLAVGGVPAVYTVTGVASAAGMTFSSPHAFVSTEQMSRLAGREEIDTVVVTAAVGVDPGRLARSIEAAVSRADVRGLTGDDRGNAEFLDVARARTDLVVLASSLAGTALLIAMFVVASTLGLSIHQRRREFALLRAVAATPRQIQRLIAAEIRLVAGTAALAGVLPGLAVAHLLRAAFAGSGLLPADYSLAVSPAPAVVAVLLSLGCARAAALVAAHRHARLSPLEALGEAAVEPGDLPRGRVAAGWALAVLGVASSLLPTVLPGMAAVAGAAGSAMFLVIAVALLGPRLFGSILARAARPLARRSRISGHLAAANAQANSRRLAAAVTPLVLAIVFVSVQVFSQTTIGAAAGRQSGDGVVADRVITAPAGGIDPAVAEAVGSVDGVGTVAPVARSQVYVRYSEFGEPTVEAFAAQGVTVEGLQDALDLEPRLGDLGRLNGDTVAVSEFAAETFGVEPGDRLPVVLGDGTEVDPAVVAVYGRGLGFGDITLPYEVLVGHTTSGRAASLLVTVENDTAAEDVAGVVDEFSGLTLTDRAGVAAAGQEQRRVDLLTTLVALAIVLVYIAVAVVNTLVMATADRSREFALLRLVGAGSGHVRRMMRAESAVVVGVAAMAGTLVAIPPLVGFSLGRTGAPIPAIPVTGYLAILGGTAVLGAAAIAVPTRIALRRRPIDAIGLRE